MISFAQNFEDVILNRVFASRKTGLYIDVGAADPEFLSVTKWFYDQGWNGINIEPNPVFHRRLSEARPRDINLMCGAGRDRSGAPYFELPFKELSSFDPAVKQKATERGEQVVEHEIDVVSLNSIIDQYAKDQRIDFLKVDVEGSERDVISSIDLAIHRPTVIVVEATYQETSISNHEAWEDLLVQAEYECSYFDGLNRFYIGSENRSLSDHFVKPPNIFDSYVTAETVKLRETVHRQSADLDELRAELDKQCSRLTTAATELQEANADRHARLMLLEKADDDLKELQRQVEDAKLAPSLKALIRRLWN